MKPQPATLVVLTGAVLGSITLGWLFGLPELIALAVAAGTVALACLTHLLLGPGLPDSDATVHPSAVTRDEPARLELLFSNRSTRHTRATKVSGRFGPAGKASVDLAPLPPGGAATVLVDLPTPERGVVRFGPLQLATFDPLRVWKRLSTRPIDATLLVRPRVHPLVGVFGAGGSHLGAGHPSASVHGGPDAEVDLVGLRPYVPGDDLRRIHWRTSARRNEPHVVQVEPPVGPAPVIVVLDTRVAACDPTRFEFAVEAAASICSAATAAGRPVRVITLAATDARPPADFSGFSGRSGLSGPAGLTDALDTLAGVVQSHLGDLSSTLDGMDPRQVGVVVCTGDPMAASQPGLTKDALVVYWNGSGPLADAVGTRATRVTATGDRR